VVLQTTVQTISKNVIKTQVALRSFWLKILNLERIVILQNHITFETLKFVISRSDPFKRAQKKSCYLSCKV
jgi:hypothetical protein